MKWIIAIAPFLGLALAVQAETILVPIEGTAEIDTSLLPTGSGGADPTAVVVYDETQNPPTTNGPGGAPYRLGSPGAYLSRILRPAPGPPPSNVKHRYEQYELHGESETYNQGGSYPLREPGATCPAGGIWPNCTVAKNHTGVEWLRYVKQAESEDAGWVLDGTYAGPGDAILHTLHHRCIAPNAVGGDEGCVAQRIWLFDALPAAISGVLGAPLAAETTTTILPNSGYLPYLGRGGLLVFDDPSLSDRRETGVVASFSISRRTWKVVNPSGLPPLVYDPVLHHTGYAFHLNRSARAAGYSGGIYRPWLLIRRGPGDPLGCVTGCAADEFETWTPRQGQLAGAPEGYVTGELWTTYAMGRPEDTGRIAPAEQLRAIRYDVDPESLQVVPQTSYPLLLLGPKPGRTLPAGTRWDYSLLGVPQQFRGIHVGVEIQNAESTNATGVLVTTGAAPDSQPIYAPFQSQAKPDAKGRPTQRYGHSVGGPAAEAAYVYQTYPYGAGWAERTPLLKVMMHQDDFGTDGGDRVPILDVGAWNNRVIEYLDTRARTRRFQWTRNGVADPMRQPVEVATRAVALVAQAGDLCADVCLANGQLSCLSWRSWEADGRLVDGGLCSEVAVNGGYCHCGTSP